MNKDDCFELGYIIKKHGLQGEVSILLDTDYPENYINMESVFVEIQQKLVPFFIESISINGDKAIVKFEEIDSVEQSEDMKGFKLFLPLSQLPPLSGKDFYFHEVLGFSVEEKNAGPIGIIKDVFDASAQHLFAIDYNGREILIPVTDEIIVEIDRENKSMLVSLPEGLLDIYLE